MKQTFYYVQVLNKDNLPEIIYHSQDDETGEFYYKFLDKKKAQKLLDDEKKVLPNKKFRLVKLVETYTVNEWL